MLMTAPYDLTDDDLIATIASLAGNERVTTARLIAHLAELEARNLHLAHGEIPNGDLGAIFVRGITLQLQEAEKKKFAVTSKPRPGRGTKPGSRHVPADVQRKVWRRDGGQCAFEGPTARCSERSFLEFHHVRPWVVGGPPTADNIALRCRAHNAYEAAVYFGPIRAAMAGRNVDSFRNESGTANSGATAAGP